MRKFWCESQTYILRTSKSKVVNTVPSTALECENRSPGRVQEQQENE